VTGEFIGRDGRKPEVYGAKQEVTFRIKSVTAPVVQNRDGVPFSVHKVVFTDYGDGRVKVTCYGPFTGGYPRYAGSAIYNVAGYPKYKQVPDWLAGLCAEAVTSLDKREEA
jgi:hypothetical protein